VLPDNGPFLPKHVVSKFIIVSNKNCFLSTVFFYIVAYDYNGMNKVNTAQLCRKVTSLSSFWRTVTLSVHVKPFVL
jgi:hypothetical protein